MAAKNYRSWETPYLANLERTADKLRDIMAATLSRQKVGGHKVDERLAKAVHDYDKVRKRHS